MVIRSWLIVLEPKVARNVAVTVTVSSATVTWQAPVSGHVDSYEITINADTKSVHSSNTKSATFDRLEAGTQYAVSVVAISGGQRSEASQKTFYTSSKCFHKHIYQNGFIYYNNYLYKLLQLY